MLLGFISLLLTVGQTRIAEICISEGLGDSLLPCAKEEASENSSVEGTEKFSLHRKLMFIASETPLRRSLATDEISTGHCAKKVEI